MSDDIGPGDVVEAVINDGPVKVGDRTTVVEISIFSNYTTCICGLSGVGMRLRDFELPNPTWRWCPCGWRKIGGSRADIVRRFAEDLTVTPERVDA